MTLSIRTEPSAVAWAIVHAVTVGDMRYDEVVNMIRSIDLWIGDSMFTDKLIAALVGSDDDKQG